jgi:hypothetical protein
MTLELKPPDAVSPRLRLERLIGHELARFLVNSLRHARRPAWSVRPILAVDPDE